MPRRRSRVRRLAPHRCGAARIRFAAGVVEVLVPMQVRRRRRNVIVHHTRSLEKSDRTKAGLIPVTTKARTLIDLGAVAPPNAVEEAFDGAQRDGGVRQRDVERRYADLRVRGRNGIGAMTQILARRAGAAVPRSVLEREPCDCSSREDFRRRSSATGRTERRTRYELDFAYPAAKLAIEVDGHGSHATRRQRAADNVRANALSDVRWRIRRFTYEQVLYDSAAVIHAVRLALSPAL